MAYYGNKIDYKGFYKEIKAIVIMDGHLLIQFESGRIISYELNDLPKILFDECKQVKQ